MLQRVHFICFGWNDLKHLHYKHIDFFFTRFYKRYLCGEKIINSTPKNYYIIFYFTHYSPTEKIMRSGKVPNISDLPWLLFENMVFDHGQFRQRSLKYNSWRAGKSETLSFPIHLKYRTHWKRFNSLIIELSHACTKKLRCWHHRISLKFKEYKLSFRTLIICFILRRS